MKYNWHDMARHLVLLWNLGNKLRFVFVLCRGLVGLATPCRGCGCGGSGAVDVRGSASTVNGHVACRASNRVYLVKLGHTSGHGTFSDRVVSRHNAWSTIGPVLGTLGTAVCHEGKRWRRCDTGPYRLWSRRPCTVGEGLPG